MRARLGVCLILCLRGIALAAEAGPRWSGKDLGGAEVRVPAAGRPTVVVFLQPGQRHSDDAAAEVGRQLAGAGDMAVVGVVSGPAAEGRAGAMGRQRWGWPVLADEKYAASGVFSVSAWPTTVVFDAGGAVIGRLPGFPMSYGQHLAAYVDFARGKMTPAQLETALTQLKLVQDSADQKAERHLVLVEALLASRPADAAEQLRQARELAPAGRSVRLRMVRAELLLGEDKLADDLLATLDERAGEKGQMALLHGWAAMASGRWSEAKEQLELAQKEGVTGAELQYRLGLLYTHEGDARRAAESFRRAFEAAWPRAEGGELRPTLPRPQER